MLKRYSAILLLVVCLSLLFQIPAYADVIDVPYDNNYSSVEEDFLDEHIDECTPLYESFYANGKDGYVSVKREPGKRREIAAITNGEIIEIMYTYTHKDAVWGVAEVYTYDEEWQNGWIPMDQLLSEDEPASALIPPSQPGLIDTLKNGSPILIIALVVVLIAVTAVLIRVFWKPNKKKPSSEK